MAWLATLYVALELILIGVVSAVYAGCPSCGDDQTIPEGAAYLDQLGLAVAWPFLYLPVAIVLTALVVGAGFAADAVAGGRPPWRTRQGVMRFVLVVMWAAAMRVDGAVWASRVLD